MTHEWPKRFDGVEYDWDLDGGTGSDTIPNVPIWPPSDPTPGVISPFKFGDDDEVDAFIGGGSSNIEGIPWSNNAFGNVASAAVAINTIINQIIDAATLSNMPSGFINGGIGECIDPTDTIGDDDEVDAFIDPTGVIWPPGLGPVIPPGPVDPGP